MKKVKMTPVIIIAIVVLAIAYYAYTKFGGSSIINSNSDQNSVPLSSSDPSEIRAAVSKLMLLPEGEPAVFDITNPELMAKQQAFFAGAIAGDKLLMFATSGKAIIWSPSRGIIVNSGPIQTDSPQAQNKQAPTQTANTKKQ